MSIQPAISVISRISRTTKTGLFKFLLTVTLLAGTSLLAYPLLAQSSGSLFTDYLESTSETASPNIVNMVSQNILWQATTTGLVEGVFGREMMAMDPNNPTESLLPGGALGSLSNITASLYTPQASGIEYIASTWNGFLGKPAYAQGAGFQGLTPLLPLWRGFRNITYLLASLFFIVIGILIILRVKISPQAVINIQNSIPQIITTMILVTFSYAIAGLLIDLSNLVQGVAISTLFSSFGRATTESIFPQGGISTFITNLASKIGLDIADYNYNMTDLLTHNNLWQTFALMNMLIPHTVIALLGSVIGGVIGFFMGNVGGTVVGVLAGPVIILLILGIIIIVNLFKFTLGLLKVYINLLIKIIFAPLEIGLGAFPGSKTGFNTWIWEVIANLAVFPFSLIFLVVANLIVKTIDGGQLWTPSIVGVVGIASQGKILAGLVGLGAFLLFAQLPEKIPALIFALKPSEWGKAIGEGLQAQPFQPYYQDAKAIQKNVRYNRFADQFESATTQNRVARAARTVSIGTGLTTPGQITGSTIGGAIRGRGSSK